MHGYQALSTVFIINREGFLLGGRAFKKFLFFTKI